jgi:hypothetical protein
MKVSDVPSESDVPPEKRLSLRHGFARWKAVCPENFVCVDEVTESPKLAQ